MGEQGVRSTLLTHLAEALYMQGRYEEAAEVLNERRMRRTKRTSLP
jgi:hypothetical protein